MIGAEATEDGACGSSGSAAACGAEGAAAGAAGASVVAVDVESLPPHATSPNTNSMAAKGNHTCRNPTEMDLIETSFPILRDKSGMSRHFE